VFYLIEKTGALNQGLNQLIKILAVKESLGILKVFLFFPKYYEIMCTIALQEETHRYDPNIASIWVERLGTIAKTRGWLPQAIGGAVVGAPLVRSILWRSSLRKKEAGLVLLFWLRVSAGRFVQCAIVWSSICSYIMVRKKSIEKIRF